MLKTIIFVVSALAVARSQIPSLGYCPEYVPMTNFDMSKFLGVWYEAERYFQITEVVSRCVMANYTRGPDGKMRVSNEVTNRFTGIKRVLEGEIKTTASKADEGQLHVKYTVPLIPETKYAVLDTDYKNYAVLWSCSGIGPINAQNSWVMTRERQAPGEVLQKAYGILDKYKISKAFFVKSDQADCAQLDVKPEAPAKPTEGPETDVEEAEGAKYFINLRSAIVPDAPNIIIETRKTELAEANEKPAIKTVEASGLQHEILTEAEAHVESIPEIQNTEPIVAAEENKDELNIVEEAVKAKIAAPTSVPEVILKTADRVKEAAKEPHLEVKQFQPFQAIQDALAKPVAQIQGAFAAPVAQIQGAFAAPVAQIQGAFAKPVAQIQDAFSKPVAQIQDAFSKPVAQIQQAFAGPIAQIQQTFAAPLQNLQQAFAGPVIKVPEANESKPVDKINEQPNMPAAVGAPEKLSEKLIEVAPKEEEKKEELPKVVS